MPTWDAWISGVENDVKLELLESGATSDKVPLDDVSNGVPAKTLFFTADVEVFNFWSSALTSRNFLESPCCLRISYLKFPILPF